MRYLWLAILLCISQVALSQSLYLPGGAGGILNSNNSSIGIGTMWPRSPLEIFVPGNNTTVQSGLIIQQTNPNVPNNSAGVSLDFGIGNNGVNNSILGKITLKETWWAQRPKMVFSLNDENNTMMDRMMIDTYGNVGVGTSNPVSQFQINGESQRISFGNVPQAYRSALGWVTQYIGFNISRDATGWLTDTDSNSNGASMILADPFGNLKVVNVASSSGTSSRYLTEAQINDNTKFIISPSGNVGVGTTTLDAKLTVKGNIHTQEVKVDVQGSMVPDYVFGKDYNLPSLDSIKTYIDENKHLPEVPSAKEMEVNGIQLGEMNMLLLKKMEEMTLYIIEMRQQNDQLHKDNKQLNERITRLEQH